MTTGLGKVREYKILLGVVSVIAGLSAFYVLAVCSYGIIEALACGLIISLLYPMCAALAAKIIYRLFKFALVWDKNYIWSIEYQILIGSFWPITLPASLVMGLYSLIINRLFPED